MVTQSSGGGAGGKKEDDDAKHMFDRIGQQVHDKVKNGGAKTYFSELKGNLASATRSHSETAYTDDPCDLKNEYTELIDGSGGNGERYPCANGSGKGEYVNRFSDTLGGQCTDHRIKGNKNNCGACAPLRRLHLCHHNLESIETNNYNSSKAKHKLLLEVCMAAYYEGQSIKDDHAKYRAENNDFKTNICTELARSFADIGDIVRGKDLYRGYDDEEKNRRKKLQQNLKKIFKNIYKDVTKTNGEPAKKRYNDTTDYFQLREDWWALNRNDVWKAITCEANGTYFHATCSDGGDSGSPSVAQKQCRCGNDQPGRDNSKAGNGDVNIVPTYFDYVPQYLRWFEEWAEDFCRKRKHKLENAKNKCRGENGEHKYCSGNGYDCEKTIRGDLHFVEGDCHDCSVACSPFVKWLDNQKLEFDKQKNKYAEEIKKAEAEEETSSKGRKKRSTKSETYEGYDKDFYNILKGDYKGVDKFLKILNKEGICKEQPKVKGETADSIDFKNENTGKTFSRTEICEPCPWCGAERKSGGNGKWTPKNLTCGEGNDYKKYKFTNIPILTGDKTKSDMVQKYNKFCNGNGATGAPPAAPATTASGDNATTGYCGTNNSDKDPSLCEPWQCYYYKKNENNNDSSGAINFCVLQKEKQEEKDKTFSSYNAFFWMWVHDMLIDSIKWRDEHGKCINKDNGKTCKRGCNKKCDCFLKWVQQKEKEWRQIKVHFDTQDFGSGGGILGSLFSCPSYVLKTVLKLDELFNNIKSGYGNAKELEGINKMLEKEKQKNQAEEAEAGGASGGAAFSSLCTEGGVAEQETTIDKFLQEEEQFAETCKNCQEPPPKQPPKPSTEDLARSLPGDDVPSPQPPRAEESDDNVVTEDASEVEEEDEDEDEIDDVEVDGSDGAANGEETQEDATEKEVEEPTTTTPGVKPPCDIVAELFEKPESLQAACSLKYGPKAPTSWRCIPSGDKAATGDKDGATRRVRSAETTPPSGTNQGSICVPPRRRKLYVGKLTQWAATVNGNKEGSESGDSANKQTQQQAEASNSILPTPSTSSGSQSHPLLTAFVESAAVETFFLWDRYKKLNTPQSESSLSGTVGLGAGLSNSDDPDNPQTSLQNGNIPPEFLRQMFYTLGDYRDILVGDNTDILEAATIGSDNKTGKEIMDKIQKKIKEILPTSGNKENSVPPQTSDKDPKDWWNNNAKHIWHGMICALTYEEDGSNGQSAKIKQNSEVKQALLESDGNKPKDKYQYNTVTLDDTSGPSPNSQTTQSSSSGDKTYLSKFVLRPPYFRYLHEWGQNFCKKRTEMLAKIRGECMDGSDKKYSGDGEDCKTIFRQKYNVLPDLSSRCAKPCSSYRKWIGRKKEEFIKQSNVYEEQKQNCGKESAGAEGNNGGNGFCVTPETTSTTAAEFLQKLGPCKKDNDDNEIGEGKKIFQNTEETFRPAKNCAPCSQFKIKCENCKSSGDVTNVRCYGNNGGTTTITAKNIIYDNNGNGNIEMRVSDNTESGKEFDDLKDCKNANIFQGIRKDEWKCGYKCGYNVCEPVKVDGKANDEKHIITIRALVAHWVQNFLDDYNKIKQKISHCIKNSDRSKCENKCNDKCNCVREWLKKKTTEWKTIRDRYINQYRDKNMDGVYKVRAILEDLQSQIPVTIDKAIEPCKGLEQFEKSCGLNSTDSSKSGKKDENNDHVLCMLNKLEKKANKCKDQASGENQTQAQCDSLPLGDEDDEHIEEEENPENMRPGFCPKVDQPTEPEPEETCDASPGQPDVKEEEEKKEEKKDKEEEPEPPVKPTPASPTPPRPQPEPPSQQPRPALDDPAVIPALVTSTLAWSVGIGFAAFTYFYLKKKTKSSVGNLFQILQIPKSDYDIPTKLSPNRYIPYTSGKYRGKRYIYLEGDSGTDSGYTDHYSDITSSSESEYEEMDINDIYVPGSPKYKTLIEVVLEPSGNNTTASGNNTTASDTQNDIQNDGIPSSKITDNEWNQLKHDFISNMLQNEPKDVPNDYKSGDIPLNTQPNTLYFDKPEEKPFITSIHDRDLYTGEEYNYNVNMVNSMNDIPINRNNNVYSGIDLINDTLSGNEHIDIYDELLKRKENELFGTNYKKNISNNSVAKLTNSDPIMNQLDLFHQWLDRHRDMCEQWNNKEEVLDKLKEEWENETHSGNKHSDIPSGKLSDTPSDNNIHSDIHPSDIPSGKQSDIPSDNNIHSDIPYVLNTDVSIQIHMDNPKPINEFTNMDTILEDLDKYNEPYYYDMYDDDIYYDVNDHDTSTVDSNAMDVPSKVQIEMDVNTKLVKEKYPIADVWDI